MDIAFPRAFGDRNAPTRPHHPEDSRDALDREQLAEVAPGTFVPAAPADGEAAAGGRRDGWTPDRRARFCELIADGMTVEAACYALSKAVSSVYALKRRPDGASFALAWEAANLIARGRIADRMLSRALDGQVERVVKPNGDVIERHRFDNRLALHMLARLDRQAEGATGAEGAAARLIAQDFDGFVDLVRRDAAPARAGLFLLHAGQTGAADLAPIAALARADAFLRAAPPPDDGAPALDADRRHEWTAEQWRRAEAEGLVAFAPPPQPPEETAHEPPLPPLREPEPKPEPVWWDDHANEWRTSFPPPEDFAGFETYEPGHLAYERGLSEAEAALMGPGPDWYDAAELAEQAAARDAWFNAARASAPGASADEEGPPPEDARIAAVPSAP